MPPDNEEEYSPMAIHGFFDLRSAEHLLRQLERAYARLQQAPTMSISPPTSSPPPRICPSGSRGVAEGYIKPGYMEEPLHVRLRPEQAAQRGEEGIDVLALANEVLAFWPQSLR
jgi:hypothetical protein